MRKEYRIFNLQGIKKAKVIEETFLREENININEIIGEGLDIVGGKGEYNIEVRIEYPASLYIQEKKWHPSQKIKVNKDKSINISLTLNSLREAFRWVLSMGSNATVIKPRLLKEDIKKELKELIKKYR
jgi:proteasome accessory factor B